MEVTTEVTTTQESRIWLITIEVKPTEIMFQCSIKGQAVLLKCRDLMIVASRITIRPKIQDQRLLTTKHKTWTRQLMMILVTVMISLSKICLG